MSHEIPRERQVLPCPCCGKAPQPGSGGKPGTRFHQLGLRCSGCGVEVTEWVGSGSVRAAALRLAQKWEHQRDLMVRGA